MGVWGVGKERERKTQRCNGREVHGSGKQVIGVNGLRSMGTIKNMCS